MDLRKLLGITFPIVQAPMAGVQGSALALAVSNAGGLGSLPCAMLDAAGLARELAVLRDGTTKPCNVNFFCHAPPQPDAAREARWRAALARYFSEFAIDPASIAAGPGRAPFSAEAATLLEEFRPAVVSFHFGLAESPDPVGPSCGGHRLDRDIFLFHCAGLQPAEARADE